MRIFCKHDWFEYTESGVKKRKCKKCQKKQFSTSIQVWVDEPKAKSN